MPNVNPLRKPLPYEIFHVTSDGQIVLFVNDENICVKSFSFDFLNTIEFKSNYVLSYATRKSKTLRILHGVSYYKHKSGTSILEVSKYYERRHRGFVETDSPYFRPKVKITKLFYEDRCNMLWRFKQGYTFDENLKMYSKRPNDKLKDVEVYLTKIYQPDFRRTPENPSKNTFDTIFIQCNTNSQLDVSTFLRNNKKQVIDYILNFLENNRSFKKYGIPINFLRITSATFHKKLNLLDFIFELKPIVKETTKCQTK